MVVIGEESKVVGVVRRVPDHQVVHLSLVVEDGVQEEDICQEDQGQGVHQEVHRDLGLGGHHQEDLDHHRGDLDLHQEVDLGHLHEEDFLRHHSEDRDHHLEGLDLGVLHQAGIQVGDLQCLHQE